MGPPLIPIQDRSAAHLLLGLRSARNRVLVPTRYLCQCWIRECHDVRTVGICQLLSLATLGGSAGAIALLARSEARVMRGMMKQCLKCVVLVESWKVHRLGEECANSTATGASQKRTTQRHYSIAPNIEAHARLFFSFSSMSYRQSLESRDVDFNGCLGPSRTSCVLTIASERSGNRCSTNQTSI